MSRSAGALPPVHRARSSEQCTVEKHEWKKFLKKQQSIPVGPSRLPYQRTCLKASLSTYTASQSHSTSLTRRRSLEHIPSHVEKGSQPSLKKKNSNVSKPNASHLCNSQSVFGDKKIFLQGSETLETLSKLLKLEQSTENSIEFTGLKPSIDSRLPEEKLQRTVFYYDTLKSLLEKRSILSLKRECITHIQLAREFVSELRRLAEEEWEKLTCILLKTHVKSHQSTITMQASLLEDLSTHIELWPSLLRNLSRIINLFHFTLDPGLQSLMIQTSHTLKRLKYQAFFWMYQILDTDIKILCNSDVYSIPSEVLQTVFEACEKYNKLLYYSKCEKISDGELYADEFLKLHKCIMCQTRQLSCSSILKCLSQCEACYAAEKIVKYFTSEGLKNINVLSRKELTLKWIPDKENANYSKSNDTSDYYSASTSDLEVICAGKISSDHNITVKPADSTTLASVVGMSIHCNQTLLLKFLFAITCMGITQPKEVPCGKKWGSRKNQKSGSRQKWKKPVKRYSSESCSRLEKLYWHYFWLQLEKTVLKLLRHVPENIYSDPGSGSNYLWPNSFMTILLQQLKDMNSYLDLPPEGKTAMKNIYHSLFIQLSQASWDEKFCAALAVNQFPNCPAVPVLGYGVGTNPGNLLCSSVEPLVGCLLVVAPEKNWTSFEKIVSNLQCTLEHLIIWAEERTRTCLLSWNSSSYLLITCSDLKQASDLLVHVKSLHSQLFPSNSPIPRTSASSEGAWKLLLEQVDALEHLHSQASTVIFRKTYTATLERLSNIMPLKFWKKPSSVAVREKKPNRYIQEIVTCILHPVIDTLSRLPPPGQIKGGCATVTAISQAWLDFIWTRKIKFCPSGGQLLGVDIQYLLNCVSQSSLDPEVINKVFSTNYVKKLHIVAELLCSGKSSRNPVQARNKVVPLPESSDVTSASSTDETITECEKELWQSLTVNEPTRLSCSCCPS